ncbi:MAG: bifunctional heptose 7-phosphate kinase/heptose 1-phosphate adenyltransferase [Salibacteraceae bacterium]
MNQHLINRVFDIFPKLNALVIGDVMIDAYLFGVVDRVSPEAPVPVVSVNGKENRLGGAANVALNIKALGANPILCCVVGNDENANVFNKLMDDNGLAKDGIFVDESRPTTVKTRVISQQQQMLRIDEENSSVLSESNTRRITDGILNILKIHQIDVVIFEDYDKGLISPTMINEIVEKANKLNIPITVDPKKRNFTDYKNVTLFKPNLKEMREGLNIEIDPLNINSLEKGFEHLQKTIHCTNALITLSEHGMFITDGLNKEIVPAHVRNIADVSGAGDTVVSVASLSLAAGMDAVFATKLANLAGGLVCEKVGVIPIDGETLKAEALRIS